MLSKKDITTLKEILTGMQVYMDKQFAYVREDIETVKVDISQMKEDISSLKIGLASVQDIVINTNAYIEGELSVNLHPLEHKDSELEKRIVKLEKRK